MIFIDIISLVIILGIIWAVVQTIKTWRSNRVDTGIDKHEVLLLRQKYAIAIAAHRANVNGASNPILESIEALDKIEQLEIKELSS